MRAEHQRWIDDYVKRTPHILGRCAEAVQEMSAVFPELTIVKGHVWCRWGKRGHWWLTDTTGELVDPTVSQFGGMPLTYEPWCEGDEVCVGTCMECGGEIWEGVRSLDEVSPRSFCTDNDGVCERSYLAALNAGLPY